MAAVLACGEGAVLSHRSAGALHGIRQAASRVIDVTVPRQLPVRRPLIRAHRRLTLTPADVTVVDGIPVTTVSRTLLDLAAVTTDAQLERACEQAVVDGRFDMTSMSELLARSHGVRGVARLRRVLARGDLGENVPASPFERRFRDLCEAEGLPAPEINRFVLLGDRYEKVDFLWRRERVVFETDGARFHSSGWARRRDEARNALLSEYGYTWRRIPEASFQTDPLRHVYEARALIEAAVRRTAGTKGAGRAPKRAKPTT